MSDAALIGIACGTSAIVLWFAVCNERTYRQRMAILNRIYSHRMVMIAAGKKLPDWKQMDKCLSYDRHLLSLMFFVPVASKLEEIYSEATA